MRISIIGTGNVALHLGCRLLQCGHKPVQVYGRSADRAGTLGRRWACPSISDLSDFSPETDVVLLAVSDQAISGLSEQLAPLLSGSPAVVAHTSGATSSQALQACAPNCGVFYPLQTFSGSRSPDFDSLPLCYYSPYAQAEKVLQTLAQSVCRHTYRIDDSERAALHLAAVFVNNFSNALFALGEDICRLRGLSFDLLRPLIAETAAKVQTQSPEQVQTGPARRGDELTLQKHLDLLATLPQGESYARVYRLLSQSIQERYLTGAFPKKNDAPPS